MSGDILSTVLIISHSIFQSYCFISFACREEIHGQSALYIAAQTGQFSIARVLICKGVDVNVKTSSGDTAYHAALRNGYTAIANLIMEQSTSLKTPLDVNQSKSDNHLMPLPTLYKPKSPYSAFFDRYPVAVAGLQQSLKIPELRIDIVDDTADRQQSWFPPLDDVTRYSPDGVECNRDNNFNPFNAWPGTSMIFKQAISTQREADGHFQRSVTKPQSAGGRLKTSPVANSPWLAGQANSGEPKRASSVKLPKDLSSLLADLGLAKYQMHFEEQDIDLQVFLTMNETDLREIGINSLGARRKFLSTIEYFQTRSNYYQISEEFLVID